MCLWGACVNGCVSVSGGVGDCVVVHVGVCAGDSLGACVNGGCVGVIAACDVWINLSNLLYMFVRDCPSLICQCLSESILLCYYNKKVKHKT